MHPPLLHTQALQAVSQRGLLLQVRGGAPASPEGRGQTPRPGVGVGSSPGAEPSRPVPSASAASTSSIRRSASGRSAPTRSSCGVGSPHPAPPAAYQTWVGRGSRLLLRRPLTRAGARGSSLTWPRADPSSSPPSQQLTCAVTSSPSAACWPAVACASLWRPPVPGAVGAARGSWPPAGPGPPGSA